MSLERISLQNGPGTVKERLEKIATQLETEKSFALTTRLRTGKQDGRLWKIIVKFLSFLNLETSNAEKTAHKLIAYMEIKANRDSLFPDADQIENAKNMSRIVNKIIERLPKDNAKATTITNKFKDLIPGFTPVNQPPKPEANKENNSTNSENANGNPNTTANPDSNASSTTANDSDTKEETQTPPQAKPETISTTNTTQPPESKPDTATNTNPSTTNPQADPKAKNEPNAKENGLTDQNSPDEKTTDETDKVVKEFIKLGDNQTDQPNPSITDPVVNDSELIAYNDYIKGLGPDYKTYISNLRFLTNHIESLLKSNQHYDQRIGLILHLLDSNALDSNLDITTYLDMLHYAIAAESKKIYQAEEAVKKLVAKIQTLPNLVTDDFIEFGLNQSIAYDSPLFFILAKNEIIEFLTKYNDPENCSLENSWDEILITGSRNGVSFLIENDLIQIHTFDYGIINPLIFISLTFPKESLNNSQDLEEMVNIILLKYPSMLTDKWVDGDGQEQTPLSIASEKGYEIYVKIFEKKQQQLSFAEDMSKMVNESENKPDEIPTNQQN